MMWKGMLIWNNSLMKSAQNCAPAWLIQSWRPLKKGCLLSEYPKVLPKGRIGKAIRYTYNIYHKLTRYHLDGRLKIDNNMGENAITPIALGRKNWLFCSNDDAAENTAIMYSMFGCCKEHGVNFREWLVFSLKNIHKYDNDYSKDLAELLPNNFKHKTKIVTSLSPKPLKVLRIF